MGSGPDHNGLARIRLLAANFSWIGLKLGSASCSVFSVDRPAEAGRSEVAAAALTHCQRNAPRASAAALKDSFCAGAIAFG